MADTAALGTVVSLWRYPVKSMQGEELNAIAVTEAGLHGDRRFALIDSTGKVASAKNPRLWPHLFDFRAAYTGSENGTERPAVCITLPDGQVVLSSQADASEQISQVVGRSVTLRSGGLEKPVLEEYWPDEEGLPHRDTVTDEAMPAGTFFDLAPVHLLTTATLDRLRELYPHGRFETRRFRPNIVLATPPGTRGFIENDWIGQTLTIGTQLRLHIFGPCARCVMITLPQSDLPHDAGILRTAVKNNQGHVGVYARVLHGGTIRRGDAATR